MPHPETLTNDKKDLEQVVKNEFVNYYSKLRLDKPKKLKIKKYKILRIDKEGNKTIVYMFGSYSDEISNSIIGPYPCVMVYTKDNMGEYILEDYETSSSDRGGYFKKVENAFSKESKQDILESMASDNSNVHWEVYTKAFIKALGTIKSFPKTNSLKSRAYEKGNLEDSIKHDIINRNTNIYKDERCDVETEGHKILGIDKKGKNTIVYMIVSYDQYSLENEVFKRVSGSAGPVVMTYKKNKNGEHILEKYKEPGDGTLYVPSIRKMFPPELQDKAINGQEYYNELEKQEKKYLKEYLKSIGINKTVKIEK